MKCQGLALLGHFITLFINIKWPSRYLNHKNYVTCKWQSSFTESKTFNFDGSKMLLLLVCQIVVQSLSIVETNTIYTGPTHILPAMT